MRVGGYTSPPRPLSLNGKEREILYSDPRGIWFVVIRWTAHHLVGEAKQTLIVGKGLCYQTKYMFYAHWSWGV